MVVGACLAGHGCAGYNSYGRLGDGTTTDRAVPAAVSGGYSFAQISAGGQHTCGVLTNGAGLCWGECCERAKLLPCASGLMPHSAHRQRARTAVCVVRAHCSMS